MKLRIAYQTSPKSKGYKWSRVHGAEFDEKTLAIILFDLTVVVLLLCVIGG